MSSVSLRLVLALPLFALAACGSGPSAEGDAAASAEPTAPSSEWVAQNPTEPAVPVQLPETPMTNAPAQAASPAAQ